MYFRIRTAAFVFPTELEICNGSGTIIGDVIIDRDGTTSINFRAGHDSAKVRTQVERKLARDGWCQTEAELVASRTADRDDNVLTQS